MAKVAVIVLADTVTHEGLGRAVNALEAVKELQEAGDDVELIFDGAGTRWVGELANESHRAHALYSAVRGSITGACAYCAGAFEVAESVKTHGVGPARAGNENCFCGWLHAAGASHRARWEEAWTPLRARGLASRSSRGSVRRARSPCARGRNGSKKSSGIGNSVVELFSAATSPTDRVPAQGHRHPQTGREPPSHTTRLLHPLRAAHGTPRLAWHGA